MIGQTHRFLAAAGRKPAAPPPGRAGPATDGTPHRLGFATAVGGANAADSPGQRLAGTDHQLALGVLECDGVWVLAGIGVAGVAVSVVSAMKAGVYFFSQVLS